MNALRGSAWLIAVVSLVVACADDHPPPAAGTGQITPPPVSGLDASTGDGGAKLDVDAGPLPDVPGKLDPARVYFFGYRTPKVGDGEPVIIDPASPSVLWGGFGRETYNYATIRPDGRLLVSSSDETIFAGKLYVFQPDPFMPIASGGTSYPVKPLANDTVLDTSVCPDRPWNQRAYPDDGVAIHTCEESLFTYYLQGSKTPLTTVSGARLVALGTGRSGLLSYAGGFSVQKADGNETPVVGIEPNSTVVKQLVTARFGNGGFSVVFERKATPGVLELGTISLAGVFTTGGTYSLGAYPFATLASVDTAPSFAIDAQGHLFAVVKMAASGWEVTRFEIGAAPSKVYDESGSAEVKFWDGRARLVTGS